MRFCLGTSISASGLFDIDPRETDFESNMWFFAPFGVLLVTGTLPTPQRSGLCMLIALQMQLAFQVEASFVTRKHGRSSEEIRAVQESERELDLEARMQLAKLSEDPQPSAARLLSEEKPGGASSPKVAEKGIHGRKETDDIDDQMREAYVKFKKYFRLYDFPTSPAYEAVALLASLRIIKNSEEINDAYFSVQQENVSGLTKTQEVWTLFEQFRVPQTLYDVFDEVVLINSRLPRNLVLLAEYGETAEDEVVVHLTQRLRRVGVEVAIIFLTKEYENSSKKYWKRAASVGNTCAQGVGECMVSAFDSPANIMKVLHTALDLKGSKETVVLQLGPIWDMALVKTLQSALGAYNYVLLGLFGKTYISNHAEGKSYAAAALSNGAIRSIIVDTGNGAAAFPFSYGPVRSLFPEVEHDDASESIAAYVIRDGWRSLVGRVSPAAGRHVAHLVAQCEKCANYKSVKSVVERLQMRCYDAVLDLSALVIDDDDYGKVRDICDPANGITGESISKAKRVANKYIDELKVQRKSNQQLIIDANGGTNNAVLTNLNCTCADIRDGYVFILTHMNYYFGVPIEFFESGTAKVAKPQWSTPTVDEKHAAIKARQTFEITLPTGDVADDYDACRA